MKFKDYYEVLGVDRKAKAEEIRRAYRQLARKFHPDVNKTDPGAEERFKEINEAYEVLKDPEKRGHYDQLGKNWKAGQDFRPPPGWEAHFGGGAPGNGGGSGFDFGGFSDFFEALFGGRAGGASPSGGYTVQGGFPFESGPGFGGQQVRRPPEATEAELEVSIENVIRGGTVSIALSLPGRGRRTYNVRIPAGIQEGKRIRLGGEGESGTDLLLKVRYASDRRWQRDGANLVTTAEIKPSQAALGDKVSVQAPDGQLTVKVPAGSSSGRKLRVRGHGLPTEGGGRGDLLVEIAIVVPAELSDDEKKLFEALRDAGL